MSRRARFLEVLGVNEEWVPRRAPALAQAVEVAAEVAMSVTTEMAPDMEAEPAAAAAVAVQPQALVAGEAGTGGEAPAAAWAEPAAAPQPEARPEAQPRTGLAPAAPAIPHAAPGAGAREAAIAGLDWAALEARVSGCTDCGLCDRRTQTVFGVGDRQAEWMLVGEAPGENEDKQGEPFVGQAGKLLDNMLAAVGLARGRNVFIANVLKCRPPGNRNPEPDEVAQCEPYLRRQIALVRPKLIVVLGRFAAQSLLRTTTPIGKLRGSVHSYEGIPVVVTYHPAYLLRTLTDKARAWEDLCLAREVHARAGAEA
ncbi:uracil-DNA glycosylase [Cupriavidus sp. 30B13]|uniref:uracil-DNA glycosylase n=1 Tax=Cupriavidus sp. 30B13 TaxID=3384241 RepID=UPI003B9218DB